MQLHVDHSQLLVFPVSLQVRYEIDNQGRAFYFLTDQPSLPSSWSVSVQPSTVFYRHLITQYFWYVSNFILWRREQSSVKSKTFMAHVIVHIHKCISEHNSTNIAVYPGLLSLYGTRWQAKPHTRVNCSTYGSAAIPIDFHMYATIVLNAVMHDNHILVNMSFYQNPGLRVRNISRGKTGSYTTKQLPKYNRMVVGHLSAPLAELTFTDIQYTGEQSTVKPDVICRVS